MYTQPMTSPVPALSTVQVNWPRTLLTIMCLIVKPTYEWTLSTCHVPAA
jgi:hypothetical protein